MTQTPLPTREFEDFARWYASRRLRRTGRQASPSTLRTKKLHLAAMARISECESAEFLGNHLKSRDDVELLLDKLAMKMTPGAMRVAVYALIDFGEFARLQGWVDEPQVSRQDIPPKNPAPAITVYTPEEMERFVSAARGQGVRWWAFMAFLVDTGRRVGETLNLRWEWFKLDAKPMPYIELPEQKNGNPQYIPLGKRLTGEVFTAEHIEEMKRGRATMKRSPEDHPFPWGYRTVNGMFERFCEKAGLPNRGFHCFRHTYITDQLADGVPLQAVSTLVGHANPGVTMSRYNHLDALRFSQFVK